MQATGIGVIFNGALGPVLARHPACVDYVSVIPERFWTDAGRGSADRFRPLAVECAALEALGGAHPLVAHGVGLSIASGSAFDLPHVEQLASWQRRFGFRWVSEHLSAVRVQTEVSVDHHAGLALPLPWDEELLDLLVGRVEQVQVRLGDRLLLENGVVHTPVPGCEMTEVEFLNRLCERSGCALLLDLHNLHVNGINLGLDTSAFLAELDLSNVLEIHIAGGNRLYGVYLDSHAGPCPPEVWHLLEEALPRCSNLRGITFEFHESYFPGLGESGVLAELERAREIMDVISGVPCRSPSSSALSPT